MQCNVNPVCDYKGAHILLILISILLPKEKSVMYF
jgi:hypothetical protein